MRVRELIEQLQECDPEAVVITHSTNPELGHYYIEADNVYETDEAEESEKYFNDMMDFTPYKHIVWDTIGGKTKAIAIL